MGSYLCHKDKAIFEPCRGETSEGSHFSISIKDFEALGPS